MARSSGAADPVGQLLVQVQNDLEHLKKKLVHSCQENTAAVDIQALETAIQRTEHGIKQHTQDYLTYITCNPVTILHDQNKDKYTPHFQKWYYLQFRGTSMGAPFTPPSPIFTCISGRYIYFIQIQKLYSAKNVFSADTFKAECENIKRCLSDRGYSRGLLIRTEKKTLEKDRTLMLAKKPPEITQQREQAPPTLALAYSTEFQAIKTLAPVEKIVRGPTVAPLSVLPATHRKDASLLPPPVPEKDVQTGILSLLQRGLIPPAAHLTLVPPAIQPHTLALQSSHSRRMTSYPQGKDYIKKTEKDLHQGEKRKDYIKKTEKDLHQENQDQDKAKISSSDGMRTPMTHLTRHNVSSKTTRTSANLTNYERETRESPASQDPLPLTVVSTSIGQCVTIYNGLIDPQAKDFLAFKQHYCISWGSFMTFLERLQKLLQDYTVPVAVVNGELLRIAALDLEIGKIPSVSQLLSVLENRSLVQKLMNQPGLLYKGREGKLAAVLKIQATWRGYRDRVAYLAYRRKRWAAGVIAIAWLLYVQKSRVRKMLLESRQHHLHSFRSRAKHLASNWNHIRTCRRSIIHIPSLGYTEKQRARCTDLHIKQNLQTGRLCDIADPNVDVIYVSPVKLDSETEQYYHKLLGLRTAVLSGNPQDASELRERFTIITPEAVDRFPNHHMCLSTLLKYSPKALQRIRNLTQGREAYIVGRVPHVDDLTVADMLGVPILGTEPEAAHLYSTKSGSKRIFTSAGIPTPPGEYDIYTENQFFSALGQLITDNLQVTRWLFKVDNEFDSNGTAFCDIGVHLPCYSWALRESQRYSPDTWKQKWAQEKVLQIITKELPQVLEQNAQPVNKRSYPTWGRFLQALVSCGGIIEAYPPADSITCLTVDLLINPSGEIQIVSCGDQIHGASPLQCVGSSVPQCSMPPEVLTSICVRIGEACKARGVLGYLSVELITFIDPHSLEQQIWATDLDLCYSDQLAMTQLLLYLTNGTLDCTNSQLIVPVASMKTGRSRHQTQSLENPAISRRVAVLSTRLVHTNLSIVYYNVFFQMCKAHGIGYDVKEKQGTVFVLLENQKRHRIGMMSIAEDLQGALMTFARNLFIIHQEISVANMQGESNFKVTVQEIEAILGVTEENKLVFEK
ncbi:IQ domain-containing protein H [Gastrophryne carolinensis]